MSHEWVEIGMEYTTGGVVRSPNDYRIHRQEPFSECPNCGEYVYILYKFEELKNGVISYKTVDTHIGYYCHNCHHKQPGENTPAEEWNDRVSGGIEINNAEIDLDDDLYDRTSFL